METLKKETNLKEDEVELIKLIHLLAIIIIVIVIIIILIIVEVIVFVSQTIQAKSTNSNSVRAPRAGRRFQSISQWVRQTAQFVHSTAVDESLRLRWWVEKFWTLNEAIEEYRNSQRLEK